MGLSLEQYQADKARMRAALENPENANKNVMTLARELGIGRDRLSDFIRNYYPDRRVFRGRKHLPADLSRRSMNLAPETRARIEAALRDPKWEGVSLVELRVVLRTSKDAIKQVANELGIKLAGSSLPIDMAGSVASVRIDQIRRGLSRGLNAPQIAKELGVSLKHVMQYANSAGIKLSTQQRSLGTVKIDHLEAVRQTVMGLDALGASLRMYSVDMTDISKQDAGEFAAILKPALSEFRKLMTKLKEKASVDEQR